ncbi:uncharacterized protein B0T23DRAFT_434759 [Neurospora hispaniola]|uniref:PH domain-containing protein n=1 Tax=Neurospora hispaniola TaxID=588809 RepID=A0AAJ0IFT5_9PEZI|nr:hypothetical protein B0T23DRAFT_434759 [Neurospora hispaniola]
MESASNSTSGPTIRVPERKYVPYRQGAEGQLKQTVGNRAGRALKAPTAPVMSSSVALVETLLAPELRPKRASSPRHCSALRERSRCVSLSDGTVTVPSTSSARGSIIITWQDQDRRKKRADVGSLAISAPYKKGHRRCPATAAADWGYGKKKWKGGSRNPRSKLLLTSGKWRENLDHLLENEVEAAGDNADAAGTTGTSVTTPLLVAQRYLPVSALWISARTGKEKPSKPPLHLLPLTKYNSNDDVNRNKWEEVPGFDGDSRDLQPVPASAYWFSTSSSPSLLAHPSPLSSPASKPRLQLQACISSRAGENVDDPQQPNGNEDESSGSSSSSGSNQEKPNSSNSLSRQQQPRNKGGSQYKDILEKDDAVLLLLEKKVLYPPVPISPSSSPSSEPAHPSEPTTTTQQQHPTRKQTQTQKQAHSYLGPDVHLNLHTNHHSNSPALVRFLVSATATDCAKVDVINETRDWLEQLFKDTIGDTTARERELAHGQDHHHSFLLPLPLVSWWHHSPFDPATGHGCQPVNGAEKRPRSPRHAQAEQAASVHIKGQEGLALDKGSNLNETKGINNNTTGAGGLDSHTLQTSVPRVDTGADSRTLAERCKLETDMIMDHHQASAVPPSPALSHSSFSLRGKNRVFGKLPFLSRSRNPESPTHIEIASPISPLQPEPPTSTSPVSPASSMGAPIDKTRSRSQDAKTYAGSGGRGIVPIQDEVPRGAVNGADRRVTVRCKGVTVDLKVEVDTTTVDILLAYADKTGLPVNVNSSMVIEAYTPLGLERRLRRYERIRDVLNTWDQDMQNVLIIQTENDRSDENLDLASVPREQKIPTGFVLPLQQSHRPGKWTKRYITLLENGQLVSSKKPHPKLSDKDVLSICHLSDFDIYMPTEAQKRKELRPPKKYCYAIKSQQKATIFLSADNFVHYFSTEDAAVARQFSARVQAWRSWYLVNKVLQLHKKMQEREAEKPPQLSSAPHKPRRAVNDVNADDHKIKASVDESSYPIGTYKPLIDLSRFDKPIDEFDKDWKADRSRQQASQIPPFQLQKVRKATQEEIEAPFGTSGLLGNIYEERKLAQKEEERKKLVVVTDQPFTDRPSLLNGGLVTSPTEETRQHDGRCEPKAWLPSALEHTATQRSTRAPSVRRSAPSNQSPPSQYAPSQYAPSQYAPSQHERGRETHRRQQPNQQLKPSAPLVDLTPKFVEPPQWSREGLGRGVRAPEGMPLVDMATGPQLAPGAKPLDLPPRTLVRREPSTRTPGSRPGTSAGQAPPGSSAGSVRAVSRASSVRGRMMSQDGTSGGMRSISGSAFLPPVPPLPGSVLGYGPNHPPPSSKGRYTDGYRSRSSSRGPQTQSKRGSPPSSGYEDDRQRTFSLRNQPHPLLSFDETLEEPRGLLGQADRSSNVSVQRAQSVRVGSSSRRARNGSTYNY